MANFVFNVAKGKAAYLATLPAANDALILVALEAAGLEADATRKDYDTLSAMLAGTTNEQTTVGRKTIAIGSITPVLDDTGDLQSFTIANQTYTGPTGNAVGAFVVCYDPDTTTGTDADLIPLTSHDRAWTPDGNDATLSFTTPAFSAS